MSLQALGANKFAVIPSHHNNCINFIPSTFLFIKKSKFTVPHSICTFALLRQCGQQLKLKVVINCSSFLPCQVILLNESRRLHITTT